MAKNHSIKIDVSLGLEGIDRDFGELKRKAETGVKHVVKSVDNLTAAMTETGESAEKAGQDYEKSTEEMKESAKEAADKTEELQKTIEETSDSTDGLKESTEELGKESKETGKEQEGLKESTEETRKEVERSRESFLSWGEVAKTAVKGAAVVTGTLFAAMAAGAGASVKFGTEYKQASNTIQAQTGATKEEMEGLSEVMKNVYAGNFGEDMNDVAEAVANVKKYLGGTDKEIQKATESAIGFRDTFGYDVPESTRAASAIMKHFGGDAEHAYDLMAAGAKKGLDFSGELLDNIDEYSVQFAKAGLSAEQMFNIMAAGYEEGAWNLDKIGDAVKELNIRLVDGSDTTKEGLKAIGLNADDVAKKMAAGGEEATETYAKVVKGLAEMDDKQKQNIAGVNLFGTMWEDLGPDVVAQLAEMEGAYDDVKGTMDEINKVKYDDAASAMESLKRKAEVNLLIPISKNILPAISEATDAGIGYIDDLASAYETRGVNGLVEKAGDVFADITTRAAEEAPRMVEVAASFVDNLAGGFKENQGRLVKAGADLVKTIAGAAVGLLPEELQKPVREGVEDIVDSLTDGGIKNGLKTFGNMFENGFKAVAQVTKAVLPPFVKIVDATADHMDTLIPLLAAGATAFKGYAVVDRATKSIKGLSAITATLTAMEKANALQLFTATGALTAKEMAVGLLTGKIRLATVATAAWNAVTKVNPTTLLVTGVVAAGAALAAYCLTTDKGSKKTVELSEAEKELKRNVDDQAKAYRELQDEREKQFETVNKEYANTQALADELKTIVDENGKVKKGYEDRASVITGLLNEALGTELEITDGVIGKYEELKNSIDQVIASKKAEAIQSAMKDSYAEAINGQTEAYMNYSKAQKNAKKTTKELEEAQKKCSEVQEKMNSAKSRGNMAKYGKELKAAKDAVSELEEKQRKQQKTLETAEETYNSYVSTIENYEGVTAAIASGDAAKLEEAMLRATNSFITAENGTKESLERQVLNMKENYAALSDAVKEGAPGVTQKMVDEAAIMVAQATAEYAKMAPNASEEIAKMDPAIMGTLAKANLEGKLGEEGKKALKGLIEGLDGVDDKTREKFEMAAEGALNGLEGFDAIKTKAEEEGISFLEALAETLDVHSPSRAVKEIFSQVNPGAMEGVEEGRTGLLEKGKSLAADFIQVLSGSDIGKAGKQAGSSFVTQYSLGITSKQGGANKAAKGVANTSKKAIEAVKAITSGSAFGAQYADGINSKTGASRTVGTAMATAAKTALASVTSASVGSAFGNQYVTGVSTKAGNAKSAGKSLASNADSGAKSVNGSSAGEGFGSGFVKGITNWVGKAVQAGANLAAKTLAAAKKALDSHSPSKKTEKIGEDYDVGFIKGIVRLTGKAMAASAEFGKKTMKKLKENIQPVSLDFDVNTAMRNAEAVVQGRINAYSEPYSGKQEKDSDKQKPEKYGDIYQEININQPVKSPVEMSRVMKKEGRRLLFEW